MLTATSFPLQEAASSFWMDASTWEWAAGIYEDIHGQTSRLRKPCRGTCWRQQFSFDVRNGSEKAFLVLQSVPKPASPSSWAHPTSLSGAGSQCVWSLLNKVTSSEERLCNKNLQRCRHGLRMLWFLLTGCFWAISYMFCMQGQYVAAGIRLLHIRNWAALELEPIFLSFDFQALEANIMAFQ